ncbi:hypothetical protein NM688_g4596 [Phlebia brevispora]|uniref:Uncharacterized protein n=1 Tax=Phlebia brevispora TaxID=194682 RepID=A0ACC1T333_9APHY|nr:hypothetical protein NM688_g4596 [Phlebia brevispora]
MAGTGVAPSPPPVIHVDSTFGAAFIGVVLAAILYGVNGIQTYNHFSRYREKILRIAVSALLILDTLHLAAISGTAYFFLVTNFTNPTAILHDTPWSITTYYLTTGVMEAIVRGIFTYRIWIFSRGNLFIVGSIIIASLVNFVGNIAFTVRSRELHNPSDNSPIAWLIYMSFAGSVVADLIIATSLCVLLWRRRTGFPRTDSTIRVLMLYSLHTGALTSLCAITVLILFALMPHNFVYVIFYYLLPKCKCQFILLNAKDETYFYLSLRRRSLAADPVSVPLSAVSTGLITSNPTEAIDAHGLKATESGVGALGGGSVHFSYNGASSSILAPEAGTSV